MESATSPTPPSTGLSGIQFSTIKVLESHMKDVFFYPFPKPKTALERCKLWVKNCGRPHEDLSVEMIRPHHFVCSKHFPPGATDPVPAIYLSHTTTSTRKRPAERGTPHIKRRETSKKTKLNFTKSSTSLSDTENIDPNQQPNLNLPVFQDLFPTERDEHSQEKVEETSVSNNCTQTDNNIPNDFINNILKKNSTCFQYTGCPTVVLLTWLFEWLLPAAQRMKLWDGKYKNIPRKIKTQGRKREKESLFVEFLICLVKIRMGFGYDHLSYLFGLSTSHISRIFITWTNLLHQCLKHLIVWPNQDIVKANCPLSFSRYPRTRAIIDCTEYFVQKPLRPAAQKVTWSSYKHSNTFKQLVAISPSGTIIFLSNIYAGSLSDAKIVQASGFLELVEEGDDIMADRGFNIRHLLLPKIATLNIPAFTHGKRLGSKAVKRSRSIASVRIHVERAIRRMKTFKILSGTIPLKFRFLLHQITTIVAALCNLQPCLA